jgi:hypothetical protein
MPLTHTSLYNSNASDPRHARRVELWPRPERVTRHAEIPVHAVPVGPSLGTTISFVLSIFKQVIKSENAGGLAAQKTESHSPRTALHFHLPRQTARTWCTCQAGRTLGIGCHRHKIPVWPRSSAAAAQLSTTPGL